MYELERPVMRGDESRKKIHTPGEACTMVRDGATQRITTSKPGTAAWLRARGWSDRVRTPAPSASVKPPPPVVERKPEPGASAPAPTPSVLTEDELVAMSVPELRKLAADRKIKGRSKFKTEADLVAAILADQG